MSVNCLFGSNVTAHTRIYFAPIRIQRLKALSAYIKRCLDAPRVPDIRIVDLDKINMFVLNLDIWTESSGDIDDTIKQTKVTFDPINFFKFREKIATIISSVRGIRGVNLDYLIQYEIVTIPFMMELTFPDVNSIDFVRLNASHSGSEY